MRLTAVVVLLGLTFTTPAYGVQLGVIGTPQQASALRVHVRGAWEAWDMGRSPQVKLEEGVTFFNWEPKGYGITLPAIVAGREDYYIEAWARSIAAYRRPVYIRLAQEMNGSWYPWSAEGPAEYISMWRHTVNIFRRLSATNARFVWAPDGLIGVQPIRWEDEVVKWFPGNAYVDYVGMSTVVFASSAVYPIAYWEERLDFLRRRFHKPMILPEMKVAYAYRYKWLRTLGPMLHARPWIRLVLWSDTASTAQRGGQAKTGNMEWQISSDPLAKSLLLHA